jgi:hypothetical protein
MSLDAEGHVPEGGPDLVPVGVPVVGQLEDRVIRLVAVADEARVKPAVG